jgi:hypothetical protein
MMALRTLFTLLLLASPAFTQVKAGESKITPERIIGLYRKAVGLETLAKVHNVHVKASVTAQTSGFEQMVGDLEACYASDGRMWERNETIGHSILRGYDGQKYWASARAQSFPVWWNAEQKAETPHIPFSSPFLPFPNIERNPDDHFDLLGIADVGKQKAFLVRVTYKSGYSQNLYFDTQTYLLIRTDVPLVREVGSEKRKEGFVQSVVWSEYRTYGTVLMPHKIRMSAVANPNSGTVITLNKVEYDVDFDSKKYLGPR